MPSHNFCRDCLYYSEITESQVLNEQFPVMNGLSYSASRSTVVKGLCKRYPQTVEKKQDDECGEWKKDKKNV